MIEKRKSPRHRSFLRGLVRLGDQNYSMACIVRDISDTGAKLRFKSRMSFSGNIELHIPERSLVIQANVAWIDNCEVGVAFDTRIQVADPPAADAPNATDAELAERVVRLEAEIVALKQMLRNMQEPGGKKVEAA